MSCGLLLRFSKLRIIYKSEEEVEEGKRENKKKDPESPDPRNQLGHERKMEFSDGCFFVNNYKAFVYNCFSDLKVSKRQNREGRGGDWWVSGSLSKCCFNMNSLSFDVALGI